MKNNQNSQIQSITLCNMYFSKKVYAVYNGVWDKAPEAGELSRIFGVKSNLTVCNVTFNCKLQKNGGAYDVLVAPPIILLGSNCSP